MTDDPWRVVAGTGHRPDRMDSLYTLRQRALLPGQLDQLVCRLRDEHGMVVGISGLAIGFDTLWAHAILNAGLDLWAYIPGEWQHLRWSVAQKREWASLRRRAAQEENFDRVGHYNVGSFHARNEGMFNAADAGVTNWIRGTLDGGTYDALKYAVGRLHRPMVWVDVTRDAQNMPAEGEEWKLTWLPSENRWRHMLNLPQLPPALFSVESLAS